MLGVNLFGNPELRKLQFNVASMERCGRVLRLGQGITQLPNDIRLSFVQANVTCAQFYQMRNRWRCWTRVKITLQFNRRMKMNFEKTRISQSCGTKSSRSTPVKWSSTQVVLSRKWSVKELAPSWLDDQLETMSTENVVEFGWKVPV